MYVVRNDTKDLLVLGMLTGLQNKSEKDDSKVVYQCTVVWAAVHHTQRHNAHKVARLETVDCDIRESAADAISSYESLPCDSGLGSVGNQ